jgi:YD repeat-containing protein
MIAEDNRITITDESGQEREMEIILTFDNDDGSRHFVLFTDPNDPEGNVFAYSYDEDGNLEAVSDPEEQEMCSEVLSAFQEEGSVNGAEEKEEKEA